MYAVMSSSECCCLVAHVAFLFVPSLSIAFPSSHCPIPEALFYLSYTILALIALQHRSAAHTHSANPHLKPPSHFPLASTFTILKPLSTYSFFPYNTPSQARNISTLQLPKMCISGLLASKYSILQDGARHAANSAITRNRINPCDRPAPSARNLNRLTTLGKGC
ncbi:hypothetical protein EJ04DRAFT_29212 [Polyplosphaeria fusca]|uniref:Uncharacterized protein n=1 Tax=Polyplosphaeria fusca TaxID=682080 RepID=A0A9P4QTP0_9PLEO|nr:hypothetical protein EJ04DRAFT_29212 [Polyplosphaeria fusca]